MSTLMHTTYLALASGARPGSDHGCTSWSRPAAVATPQGAHAFMQLKAITKQPNGSARRLGVPPT